jgi:hypothetical protein
MTSLKLAPFDALTDGMVCDKVSVVVRIQTNKLTMMKKTLMTILGLGLGCLLAQAADGEAKPKPAPALPEALKKYDKNGDGKLDQEERAALQKERQAELMKKYDKNSDGKIDEEERKAMLEDRRKQRDEALAKRQAELKKIEEKKPEEKK